MATKNSGSQCMFRKGSVDGGDVSRIFPSSPTTDGVHASVFPAMTTLILLGKDSNFAPTPRTKPKKSWAGKSSSRSLAMSRSKAHTKPFPSAALTRLVVIHRAISLLTPLRSTSSSTRSLLEATGSGTPEMAFTTSATEAWAWPGTESRIQAEPGG